jgi:glycosyltransferase involved in cell wall biosynthesis
MLDIIIPHYNEPWSVGKKLFDMLALQRDIDFSAMHVFLVNDGIENTLPDEYFADMPYQVEQISIEHAGVSAARNTGLCNATSEWVMFCDFDDTFAHVYALRDIMTQLPAPDYDVLWGEMLIEDGRKPDDFSIYKSTQVDAVFTHAKLYRRSTLLEKGCWFNTKLAFNEDSEFNAILFAKVPASRVGKINTAMPLYIWCWRADSTTNRKDRVEESLLCHYIRNKNVCDVYESELPRSRYCAMVARTVWDAYFTLNTPSRSDRMEEMKRDFADWYDAHRKAFFETDAQDVPKIKAIACAEYRQPDHCENVSIEQWLYGLRKDA